MTTPVKSTHEQYIHAVRDAVLTLAAQRGAITEDQVSRLQAVKLVYGVGSGARGTWYGGVWRNGAPEPTDIIEIAALVEESYVQLAGTTVHELAHALAGAGAGHGPAWKDAAMALGFTRRPEAAGQRYCLALFDARLREAVYRLAATIGDGTPGFLAAFGMPVPVPVNGGISQTPVSPRPCSAGIGTRGGTSRGQGSGSRMRLWQCQCTPRPVKVRVASDEFRAHCDRCGHRFDRA